MENFYLEPNEELFSIIDRIKKSLDRDITLVVPSGLSALRSIINLKILKEEAISLGKSISIFTSDVLIKKLAQQSGIVVLDKSGEKPSFAKATKDKGWPEQLMEGGEIRPMPKQPQVEKKVMSDIVKPIEPAQKIEPVEVEPIKEEKEEKPIEKMEEPSFVEPTEHKPSFKFFTKKRLITTLIIICLVGGGLALYFVLPKAQIFISPKKEAIHFETEILVDKNTDSIDLDDNSIPGQVFQLEMEDSRKFPTTGEKEVEEKAKGTIMVYNQYSSDPQTLVKTTRFLSENGKLFRLIDTTVIPGATIVEGEIVPSSKEVDIMADEPGENYNIGPAKFTIPGFEGTPKYTAFYGESKESMTGGAKGIMRVTTNDDIEGALEIVSLELENKAQEEFDKKIPEELKLLNEARSLEVIQASSSLGADEPGKEFLATVKIRVWGLAFKENDVFDLVKKSVSDKISDNKMLLSSSIKVDYTSTDIDSEGGKANFSCQIEAETAWKIETEEIKNNLAGKDEVEVRKYLSSLSEIESARVIFWPFWVKRIPSNKEKIKVIIDTEN